MGVVKELALWIGCLHYNGDIAPDQSAITSLRESLSSDGTMNDNDTTWKSLIYLQYMYTFNA